AQRKEDRLHGKVQNRTWLGGNYDERRLLGEGEPNFVPLPRRCASLKERPTGQGQRRMVLAGLYRRLECLDLHTGEQVAAPLPLDGLVRGWWRDGEVALVEELFPWGDRGITLAA